MTDCEQQKHGTWRHEHVTPPLAIHY